MFYNLKIQNIDFEYSQQYLTSEFDKLILNDFNAIYNFI